MLSATIEDRQTDGRTTGFQNTLMTPQWVLCQQMGPGQLGTVYE